MELSRYAQYKYNDKCFEVKYNRCSKHYLFNILHNSMSS